MISSAPPLHPPTIYDHDPVDPGVNRPHRPHRRRILQLRHRRFLSASTGSTIPAASFQSSTDASHPPAAVSRFQLSPSLSFLQTSRDEMMFLRQ